MEDKINKTGKTIRLTTGFLLLVILMIVNIQIGLNDGSISNAGLSALNEGCVTEAGFFGLSTALFTPLAVATCAFPCDEGCPLGWTCDHGGGDCCLQRCEGGCSGCFPGCNGGHNKCGTIEEGTGNQRSEEHTSELQ